MTRRVLRIVLVTAAATLTLSAVAPPAHAQSVTGGCTVTINGIDVETAHSPGSAIEVGEDEVVRVVGTSSAPVESYDIFMKYGFIKYRAKSGTPTGDEPTWTGSVEVSDYARLGVGLYRVEGSSSGAAPCAGWAYIKINGPFPLTTAAGAVGAIAAVAGIAGMATSARPPKGGRTPGKGRRVRASLFGLLAGAGVAVLLQQFGAVPMTPAVMIGVPAGTAMIGVAIGWPKVVAGTAAAAA